MATTDEDSLPAHTSNPTGFPTSEVGYKDLLTTMKQQMDFMRDVFHTLTKKDGVELEKFSLPLFNPELAGADPMGWCETVSKLMGNEPLQDCELFFVLNRAMGGSTSQWLTQVPVCGLTWERFKEYFPSTVSTSLRSISFSTVLSQTLTTFVLQISRLVRVICTSKP